MRTIAAALAWSRVGLLDLPSIPSTVSDDNAGLNGLNFSRELDEAVDTLLRE